MALNVEVGTKLSPGATGVQTYSLPTGFGTPQALIVWASNQAATGTQTAGGMFGYGFATDRGGTPQVAYTTYLLDPSNTASRIVYAAENDNTNRDLLVMFKTPDTVADDWRILFDSFGTDQWAIDWTDLPAVASTFLHYMVIGGSDITDAYVGAFTGSASDPFDVALPSGFGQPDLLGFVGLSTGPSPGITSRSMDLGIGWAVSDTERAALNMSDVDAAGTMVTSSWAKARALVGTAGTATTADYEMELAARAGWPADGFRVTFPDPPASPTFKSFYYLALKGTFQKTILESRTTATATGNQDHDAGFVPKAALGWGHVMPSAQTIQRAAQNADATMLWVGATDGTSDAVAGISQDDGKTTSFGRSYAFNTQALHVAEAPANATRAQATASFSGNNVRYTYGTANATARQFHLLVLGDAAGGGGATVTPPLPTLITRQATQRSYLW